MERCIKYGSGSEGSTPVQNQQLNQWRTKCLGSIENEGIHPSRLGLYLPRTNQTPPPPTPPEKGRRRWRSESCPRARTPRDAGLTARAFLVARAPPPSARRAMVGRVRRVGVSVSGTCASSDSQFRQVGVGDKSIASTSSRGSSVLHLTAGFKFL